MADSGIKRGISAALEYFTEDQLASMRFDLRSLMKPKAVANIIEEAINRYARDITIVRLPFFGDKVPRFILDVNYQKQSRLSDSQYEKLLTTTDDMDDGKVYREVLRLKKTIFDDIVVPPTMDMICEGIDTCYDLDKATPQLTKLFELKLPSSVLKNYVVSLPIRHSGDIKNPGSERLAVEIQ